MARSLPGSSFSARAHCPFRPRLSKTASKWRWWLPNHAAQPWADAPRDAPHGTYDLMACRPPNLPCTSESRRGSRAGGITRRGAVVNPQFWGCTKDSPQPSTFVHPSLHTHTLTALACGDLPGSSRGYYLLATDALRLAQQLGASTAAVFCSRGTHWKV